ncbi:MAG TPA: DUF2058 family protein [Rhodanobacteraceae bacterium]|nr:DUF2058 family protein [Rhodanobacteraceae bacterium]
MADSLRDQLLKSGIVKQVRDERVRHGKPKAAKPKPAGEMDLARAWAIRAQAEAAERKRAQAVAAEQAEARRQRKRQLDETLQGQLLNKPDADLVRHFEYGGKIRRVHVDAAQLAALNAGELAVVQHGGRHALVTRTVAEQVRAFAPEQIALLVDPAAPIDDDDVPSDLIW